MNLPVLKDKANELGWTGENYVNYWDIYYLNGDKETMFLLCISMMDMHLQQS
jgi:hypothetical protein